MRTTVKAAALALCGATFFTGMIATGCGRGAEDEIVPPSHEITVPNGGFEKGTAMWSVGHSTGTDDLALSERATYEFTASADAHSGEKAALLSVRGHLICTAGTDAPGDISIDQTGGYTVSASLKIEGKTGFVSYVDMAVTKYVIEERDVVGGEEVVAVPVGRTEITTWKKGYHEYRVGDLALSKGDRICIQIGVANDAEAESRLYIDDVRLFVPGEATPAQGG